MYESSLCTRAKNWDNIFGENYSCCGNSSCWFFLNNVIVSYYQYHLEYLFFFFGIRKKFSPQDCSNQNHIYKASSFACIAFTNLYILQCPLKTQSLTWFDTVKAYFVYGSIDKSRSFRVWIILYHNNNYLYNRNLVIIILFSIKAMSCYCKQIK